MGNRDVDLEITGSPVGLEAALTKAQAAVRGAVGQMESAFGGMQAAIGKVQGAMLAFTAVLGGGAAFKAAVDATVNLSKESIQLGRTLGIGASQASILTTALGDVYATADQVTAATGKIAQTLNKDEQAFSRLGVATRDSNGHFRNSLDILLDVNSKLAGLKEGTDRNVAGVQIFGKSWASMEPLIRLNAKAMEDAADKAKALGLVIGQEDVEATTKYRAAINDAEDVSKGLGKALGDALLPILTETANWFAENGPAAIKSFKLALAAIIEQVILVKVAFQEMGLWLGAEAAKMAVFFTRLGEVIQLALHADFAGAKAAWNAGTAEIEAIERAHVEDVIALEENAAAKIAAAWAKARNQTPQTPATAPGGGTGTTDTAENRKGASAGWQTGLDEAKAAWSEQQRLEGSFREYSKAQELAYWQNILATQRGSQQEQLGIRSKIAVLSLAIDKGKFDAEVENLKSEEAAFRQNGEAKLVIAKQIAERMRQAYGDDSKEYAAARKEVIVTERQIQEQLQQIRSVHAGMAGQAAMAGIDAEEAAARDRVTLGVETDAQLLAEEQSFEDQRYAIRSQALQAALQLAMQDPDRNPVQLAQIQAEIQDLELQHQQKLAAIRHQVLAENEKTWMQPFKSLESSFKQSMGNMLKGTQGFATSMQSIFSAMVGSVIDMLVSMATTHIALQLTKLVATKTAAAGTITAHAAEAGSAGVASFAGAPWPVDIGAPAFGAAMYAASAAFGAGLAAEGGFDVPAGLNPVTQLHQREMVLPADLADTVRASAGGGGGGGQRTVVIQAVDVKNIQRWVRNPATARVLFDALARHAGRSFLPTIR